MAKPTTREQFKDHCLRRLGWPVIEINVDDDQVDDRVDEALEFFQQFHFDGTEKTYLKHQVTADDKTNGYLPLTENVKGVTRIFSVTSSNASVNMFDLRYQLRLHELYDFTSTSYVNYTLTMQHIRTLDLLFSGEVPIRFNKHTDRLYIDMDWENDIQVGEYLMLESYVIVDPETYTDVWSDKWLQKYCAALIKRQWGSNMKKYVGLQLPGGVQMDGQTLFSEALQELEQLEEELRTTYETPPEAMLLG